MTGGKDEIRILFAGGGTAGHLIPAINIADEISKLGQRILPLFIGKRGGIEREIVAKHGYKIEEIDVVSMRRSLSGIVKFMLNWNKSTNQALEIVKRFDPVAVLGTGGYVSAPAIRAAHKMNKLIFIQEQNSLPGLAARSVAKHADTIFVAYDSACKYLGTDKCVNSGNPIRTDLKNRDRSSSISKFGLSESKNTILILGGSSGASGINKAVFEFIDTGNLPDGWQILWQTGRREFEQYHSKVVGKYNSVVVVPFIDDMPSAYAAADIVLSRAGAMALSEITATGLPSVLIPYPFATGDHQTLNSSRLESAGAAIVIKESDLNNRLRDTLRELLDSETERLSMAESSRKLGVPTAASDIARIILDKINEVQTN